MIVQIVGFVVISDSVSVGAKEEGPAFLVDDKLHYMTKLGELKSADSLKDACLRARDMTTFKWS